MNGQSASHATGHLLQPSSLLLSLLVQAALFFALAEFLLRRRGLSLVQVGLDRLTWRQGALGLAAGLCLFLGALWTGEVLDAALRITLSHESYLRIAGTPWAQRNFNRLDPFWQRAAFALIGSVAAPLGEEAFFRG